MKPARAAGAKPRNPYADVQVELTAMIFDRVLPTIVSGGLIMVAITGAVARYNHDVWTAWLTVAMAILLLGRIAIVLRFPTDRVPTMTVQTAERWELLYGCYTALYMSSLSMSTLHSMYAPDSIHFTYCVFGVFVMCNAVSARLGMRPGLVLLQGGVLLGALTVAILHQPSTMARWTEILVVGYFFSFWEAIKVKFDITVDQLRSRSQQRHLAEHDALTGLANRRHFEERLAALCQENRPFAIFFLDLDGFKKVNDAHGHAAGDALLQHVAKRLEGTVRRSDLTARLGGDEFAVLHAPDATHATASALAQRLLDCISAPYRIDGLELRVGTSIGIQLSHAAHSDPDTLLSRADHALYTVKQTGKGKFHFAEPDHSLFGDADEDCGRELLAVRNTVSELNFSLQRRISQDNHHLHFQLSADKL